MLVGLYVFMVFILSSFMQTATGFGYAIITAPLLALVLEPKETVMVTMLTGLISVRPLSSSLHQMCLKI